MGLVKELFATFLCTLFLSSCSRNLEKTITVELPRHYKVGKYFVRDLDKDGEPEVVVTITGDDTIRHVGGCKNIRFE